MKNFYSLFTLIVTFLTISLSSFGQKHSAKDGHGHELNTNCRANEMHGLLMKSDPAYKADFIDFQKLKNSGVIDQMMQSFVPGTVYQIPLVVHILHYDEAEGTGSNISESKVKGMVEAANNYWRNNGFTDMEIEFSLAVRDESGNCTNGINRVNMKFGTPATDFPNYETQGFAFPEKGEQYHWDHNKYYNIVLVNKIDGNDCSVGGTRGYANGASNNPILPGSTDGTVTLACSAEDPSSTTIAHELGHAWDLAHTFEGGCDDTTPETDCSTDGDGCCDTAPHDQGDCNLSCIAAGSTLLQRDNARYNYMAYYCDVNRFTDDQKNIAHIALTKTTRSTLLAENGNMSLVPPVTSGVAFSASATAVCLNTAVQFYDESTCTPNTYSTEGYPNTSFSWSFVGPVTLSSTDQNPLMTFNTAGVYDVTLEVTNPQGVTSLPKTGYISVSSAPQAGVCQNSVTNSGDWGYAITQVDFEAISNTTGTGSNGYNDFSCSKSTVVTEGQTYNFSFDVTARGGQTGFYAVYFDYNDNATMDDATETVHSGSLAGGNATPVNVTFPVTIPSGTVQNKSIRIRVIHDQSGLSGPCDNLFSGDSEDYGLYIKPACGTVTSTTDGENCGTGTVTLGASGVGTINWYADATTLTVLQTGNSYTTPSISSSTTYYVDATEAGCTSTPRTAVNATVLAPPSAITLSAPSNASTGVALAPSFSWTTDANATSYDIQIATDAGFSSIVTSTNVATNSYTQTPDLTSNTTYHWRVRAVNSCANSTYSSTFSFTTANIVCNSYASTDVPKAINDGGTMTSIINISDDLTINDVDVLNLIGTHLWINDLTITLTSPSNTTVTLFSKVCNDEDNFDLNFDDEAAAGALPCPPTGGGTYQPNSVLSAFDGESSIGTWTLTITDAFTPDGGNLNSWSLSVCGTPVPAVTPVADFSASSTTVCAGSSITFTDASTNNPTGWTWDFDGNGTSNAQNPSVTFNTAGVYTISLNASNTAGNDDEVKTDYITVIESPETYCSWVTTKPAGPGCYNLDVERVQFNTIDNAHTSACEDIQNLICSVSTELDLNTTYNLDITAGSGSGGPRCRTWIDWDGDGLYETPDNGSGINELVYDGPTRGSAHSTTVTTPTSLPAAAYDKMLGMRVMTYFNGTLAACDASDYGEAEDYGVYIATPPCVDNTVSAASSSPSVCINTAITNITHSTTGATGIGTATGLPAGVSAAWATNTITISGTPTADGTFNYSIPLTGGCSATVVNATGTITVASINTASAASSSPSVCISTAITNITHSTTGATGIGTATGLPAGVSAAWATNTITISGTPTADGTFNYSIPLTGGCGSVNATGTITVTSANTVSAASSSPSVCINTAITNITHSTTGATGIGTATGLPAGVSAAWATNTITISGTPTADGTFNYSIPLTGGCGSAINATGTITVDPNNTAGAASSSPSVCISTAITNITHSTTGATGIGTATGLPAGVSAAWATNTITISGTPTADGTFNYSIPLTGGCGSVNATGTITVDPNNTAGAASSSPSVCISTAITNITHSTTGATGIGTATGLPAGVSAAWATNTITISGTPTANGTFNYSIPLTGGCGSVNATGTITVTSANTVSAASSSPSVCISTAITNITHSTTGATGIGTATGLPAGVSAAWATNTITISGTPTADGTFNYSIPLTGGCGSAINATGTITVTPDNTASAASSSPSLCINTAMTNVTHTTTGATGIGAATGLPAGVSAAWATNTITISGTPTADGTFNYSIPLTGGCGSVNATGTITVDPNNTAGAASSSPSVCISTAITNITHSTTGATGIGTATGLPAGVSAAWATNTITISGTPTANGTFNYSIPLTGGCGSVNATGTITVTSANTVSAASSSPSVCISTAITNITHSTTGATGIGTATGLPAGVSAAWATNTITISGTPTADGTFNYSIPLTGGCGSAINATGTITVTPDNTASAASSSPSLCINTAMTNVTHTTTGATGIGAATGLPAGVSAAWATNTITISGTPTADGTFNYSIPLTGGCGSVNATGTITVDPNNTAGAASSSPSVCISTAITNITHSTTGATGIGTATGLPAGVSAAWATNTITISGTPTANGTFNYSIPLTGGCGSVNATGTITVTSANTVSAASSSPSVCISTAITNITHSTTGATGIGTATGLPAGVSAAWATNTITISGTPTADGTFNYSIPLTGGCGSAINATGTITVTPDNTASAASSSPSLCINTAMTNVTHTTTGATGIGAATGLPAGVSAAWATNTITISGTPTADGTFNYSIPLTGGCGTVSATGTITVTSCGVGPTHLQNKFCGEIIDLSYRIFAYGVTNATQYEWEFNITGTSGNSLSYIKSDRYIRLKNVIGIEYGKTYDVKVRAFVGGSWTNWGKICAVTTETSGGSNYLETKMKDQYCGNTYGLTYQTSCYVVELATDYWWKFTPISYVGAPIDYIKGFNSNKMRFNKAGLLEGQTYQVEVQTYIDGDWRGFGPSCNVTMNGVSALVSNDEPQSQLFIGKETIDNSDIKVYVKDVSSDIETLTNTEVNAINPSIYPNPVSKNNYVSIVLNDVKEENVNISITDMYGKVISTQKVNNTNGYIKESVYISNEIASGVYFVTINTNTQRVVKRLIIQ